MNATTGRFEVPRRKSSRWNAWRCGVKGCGNRKQKGRVICKTCCKLQWRANNPYADYWHNLANSAKRRNIPFSLTLEEFTKWAKEKRLLSARGRKPHCNSVDRIRNAEGYHIGNIQILSMWENAAKNMREGFTPFFPGFSLPDAKASP